MKMILERWNGFLQERKTDELYLKIAGYMLDLLERPFEYFDIFTSVGNPKSKNPKRFWAFYTKKDAFDQAEFERYQDITGDDHIMPEYKIFLDAMDKFNIHLMDQSVRPGLGGSIDYNGHLEVYLDSAPEDVWGAVGEIFARNEILIHELTHWINSIRSGFKRALTSGSGRKNTPKQTDPEADGGVHYARSTEEGQARLVPVFDELKQFFAGNFRVVAGFGEWADDLQISVKENNPRLFVETVMELFEDELFIEKLDMKSRKRLINRIFEMFDFFKER